MTPVPGTPDPVGTAAWTILEHRPAWQVTQIPAPPARTRTQAAVPGRARRCRSPAIPAAGSG
jgi:hypothetical protein